MKNVFSMDGVPGATFTQTSSDAAAALTAANLVTSDGGRAIGVLITCETNDVRFAMAATPVADGLGHILASGNSIYLANSGAIKNFKFVSAAAGVAGVIMVTPFFEPGR